MTERTEGVFLFWGTRIVFHPAGPLHQGLPHGAEDPPAGPLHTEADAALAESILSVAGVSRRVVTWPEERPLPEPWTAHGLRRALPLLGDESSRVRRAAHLLEWRRNHRFCGRCATPTQLSDDRRALTCPSCGLSHFPRLSPAVIVLVHDGDRALLGRASRYPEGMYSTLAGFVEPGESLEQAVRREILEEAGIEVGEVEYRGSQHWPFPDSLMLGFRARWVGGEAHCADDELEDVQWFGRDALPIIPPRESIAHQLISEWAADV